MILFRTIKESIMFAFSSLVNNKLRTFLSLFGITIGIFCIISVMTVIDSLERSIRDNLSALGNNTIYVQKWPWTFGPDYPWWKYFNRPSPTLKEYEFIKENSEYAELCMFTASSSRTVEAGNKSMPQVGIIVASPEYGELFSLDLAEGRYFSTQEAVAGTAVAIIGSDVGKELFDVLSPIGKSIKIEGKKINVIGTFKKEGEMMMRSSHDEAILLTAQFGRTIFDLKSDNMNPFIAVSSKPNIAIDELQAELDMLMRSVRRLKPAEEENFSLNRASMISQGIDQIFGMLDLAGIIIGGFAILVGGFGIANIMFVSVRERTKIIGIQKAIGAKQYLILIQFLAEAVVLSLLGGLLGLFFVWLTTLVAGSLIDSMTFSMSLQNVLSGFLISFVIGIVSGFAPARAAARLDPVVAINRL